ncbi:hypothetical protein DPMN_012118 [Dreissena polymorpha]|uniref:Uncharacterized protein n=1 Tax=Dreissena polymorpha TaxID=45954 RepID=A0A9D4N1S9_DREPO|nr:hypothetical protein DPMN_012118 [Dreissena polymorpha]
MQCNKAIFRFPNDRYKHKPLPMKNSRNKLEVQVKIAISLIIRSSSISTTNWNPL